MIQQTPEFGTRHGYFHHSNPVASDGKTFYDKAFIRPRKNKAYAILKGEIKGDKKLAQQTIDEYRNLNPKMLSGVIVQDICDSCLLDDVPYNEALKTGIDKLNEFTPSFWKDQEKEIAERDHRTKLLYAEKEVKGNKVWKRSPDDATHYELDLVAQNAIEGLKAAQKEQGLNRLEAEVDIYGSLPNCELMYNGRPDYSSRIELKTQWDSNVHTDSPRVNSLPKSIKAFHLTQIAGYWHITGNLPTIVYANRIGYVTFSPSHDELKQALQFIVETCQRRERLLKLTNNSEELCRLTDPGWADIIGWKDMCPSVVQQAKKIWGVDHEKDK